jgi:hypothetical protein
MFLIFWSSKAWIRIGSGSVSNEYGSETLWATAMRINRGPPYSSVSPVRSHNNKKIYQTNLQKLEKINLPLDEVERKRDRRQKRTSSHIVVWGGKEGAPRGL